MVVLRPESRGKLRFWFGISLILLVQTMVMFLVPFGDESLPAYGLIPTALVIYLFDECIIYLFGGLSGNSPK